MRSSKWVTWLTSTDHKTIGTLYLVTAFAFFCLGGVLALFMRAEPARPGLQIMSNEQFNQAFTMHGTIMLLMFATRGLCDVAGHDRPAFACAPCTRHSGSDHAYPYSVRPVPGRHPAPGHRVR
ncbi:hypothetical protein GCM10010431_34230 [Streptomyces kunmingensis]